MKERTQLFSDAQTAGVQWSRQTLREAPGSGQDLQSSSQLALEINTITVHYLSANVCYH
ncbi:hypothetical protein ACRRTK_024286 [Alexandromys fortis]